jgi:hypothetical protein
MNCKKILLLTAILTLFFTATAQQISVKSFRALPNDMDARQNYPLKDQNGDICAIIKVVTTETGFTFDIGSLGIIDTQQKVGEIWVYIPYGSRHIRINHMTLGVLREYLFTEKIESGVCYEMVLFIGTSETKYIPPVILSQWVIITSEPSGADAYINEEAVGKTPYEVELPIGSYTWRVEKELYNPEAGKVELVEGTNNQMRIALKLKADFGTIDVKSEPEDGASVSYDGNPTGKVTPCTIDIKAGEHTIKIIHNEYATETRRITLKAGETIPLIFEMTPTFSNVSISTEPPADIYIDGTLKKKGEWNGRLKEGVHTFEARLDKYESYSEKLSVVKEKPLNLNYKLDPIQGSLKIQTVPTGATVILNGETKGTTPMTINKLLIGEYSLSLKKDDYNTVDKNIVIVKDRLIEVYETLNNYQSISIISDPNGANITINGKESGITPQKLSVPIGSNSIRLKKQGFLDLNDKFIVKQGQDNYSFKLITDKLAVAAADYKKFKTRKIYFIAGGSLFLAAGGYYFWHSEKLAKDYPTATNDATRIYDQMKREQLFTGIALGTGGACLTTSIVFAIKQHQAKKKLNVSLSALPDYFQFGISMNF